MLMQPAGKPEAWMRSTPSTQPTIAALPGRTNPHSEFSCTSDVFLTRGSEFELLIVDSLAEDRSRGRRAGKSQDHKLRMLRLRSSTVYTYIHIFLSTSSERRTSPFWSCPQTAASRQEIRTSGRRAPKPLDSETFGILCG